MYNIKIHSINWKYYYFEISFWATVIHNGVMLMCLCAHSCMGANMLSKFYHCFLNSRIHRVIKRSCNTLFIDSSQWKIQGIHSKNVWSKAGIFQCRFYLVHELEMSTRYASKMLTPLKSQMCDFARSICVISRLYFIPLLCVITFPSEELI
jgi:hypothetical protein